MGFVTASNQYTRGKDVTVLASGVVTATGASTGVDVGGAGTLRAQVVVSAASGTNPSLTVTVETSHDNGSADAWRAVGTAFAALTAAGSSPYKALVVDRYVRVSYVVSGTNPSLTFAVAGEAV